MDLNWLTTELETESGKKPEKIIKHYIIEVSSHNYAIVERESESYLPSYALNLSEKDTIVLHADWVQHVQYRNSVEEPYEAFITFACGAKEIEVPWVTISYIYPVVDGNHMIGFVETRKL